MWVLSLLTITNLLILCETIISQIVHEQLINYEINFYLVYY